VKKAFIIVLTDIGSIFAFDVTKPDSCSTLNTSSKITSFSLVKMNSSFIMACKYVHHSKYRVDFSVLELKPDGVINREKVAETEIIPAKITSNVTMAMFGSRALHNYFVYGHLKDGINELVIGLNRLDGSI